MESPANNSHIHIQGQGERVVFVHGSNVASAEFFWLAQTDLAARYEIVILERRGYGQNPESCEKGGYEANVQDIIALLGQGAHLVGHSYGGLLTMVAATRCPERVKSLVIIEPPAFSVTIHYPEVTRVVEALKLVYASATTPEEFFVEFLGALGTKIREPLRLSPLHRKAIVATMEEMEPWNISLELEKLASYTFPKLIVSGDWHPALMLTAEVLAERLQAQQSVIKGIGHEIQRIGKSFNDRIEELFCSA